MLSPDQIIPFLQHSDPSVRELALRYLEGAHDPSPATADDIWRAIDRFGGSELRHFYHALSAMPQTDASLHRTLAALRSQRNMEVKAMLEAVLARLKYGLLIRFIDLIEQVPDLSQKL